MKYNLYPGCSLERNAYAYLLSAKAIAPLLDIELKELDDWNCCGATEYISLELLPAHALISRNLAIAEQDEFSEQVVAPCSACYLNLQKTDHYMQESDELADKVNTALAAGQMHYTPGSVKVRHLLDVVANDVGYDQVAAKVARPLLGLRLVPYYGCLVLRPSYSAFDDPEYPTCLDKLLEALGADVVDYPLKGQCCGGHMTQISQPTAMEMIRYLIQTAVDLEADAIVTICPMCQLNLDAFQGDVNRFFKTDFQMPVLYFTQMLGLALGLPMDVLGIGKELVNARPVLDKIRAMAPSAELEKDLLEKAYASARATSTPEDLPSMVAEAGRLKVQEKVWQAVAGASKLVANVMKTGDDEAASSGRRR